MKKLPLGIQNIREIIEGGYVYVDKTQYVYNLIKGAKYYFLSRPRRFGKSLLLDTIGEAFSGDRELFKGLWIYDSDYSFEKHPVIRLDMSNIANETQEMLKDMLSKALLKRIKKEGFNIGYDVPQEMFKNLIEELHAKYGQTVVVLIDEYDKPILNHIRNIETANANRDVLKEFYGALKPMSPHLRLTFLTGVSMFTKASIFPDLNNLLDITLTKEYSNICGVAVEDLSEYFGEHIANLSLLEKFSDISNLHDEIIKWYGGYSWDGKSRAINPSSLFSFFMQKRFVNFWYASGTPKFLSDLINKDPGIYSNMTNLKITELMLDSAELDETEAELLLFQTGYLTVKETLLAGGASLYFLGTPNNEVREAFDMHMDTATAFIDRDDIEMRVL